MLRGIVLLSALAAAALAGCQSARTPREYALENAPAALVPAAADADSTIARLQRRLGARLKAEIEAKGAVGALTVCRDSAQVMTAEIAEANGIQAGRTSRRLRNPGNAPRAWVKPYVDAAVDGTPASSVKAVVVDLGEKVGVLRPIPTQALCLKCHGAADSLSHDLTQALRESYPEDRAVDYREGDLRGFFWAEAPKRR
ncbi:MAG TPA: DUF3365 domain-containing protein [Candidatus Eisenbacteria bacterium]|nr:DUF3365 domain-containing protein [Candidatus Eisenbacteria bacterium]